MPPPFAQNSNTHEPGQFIFWPHLLIALFAAGWTITFEIGARIYAAELVSLFFVFFIGCKKTINTFPLLRSILWCYALWGLGIIVSDLINETAIFDFARNFANPILGGISLLFVLSILRRQPSAIFTFLIVTVIFKAIFGEKTYGDAFYGQQIAFDTIRQDTNFFKVRIEPFTTPLLLIVASLAARKNLVLPTIFLAFSAFTYLFVDARSMGLVLFGSAYTIFAINYRLRMTGGQLILSGLVALGILYSTFAIYVTYTLTYNPAGHNGKQLSRLEDPYNPFELMLAGRPEWYVMPTAILEHPLVGSGSWAQDSDFRYANLWANKTNSYGYQELDHSGYIPAHSLLGSAWIWSGVVAFFAMIGLLLAIWRMARLIPLVHQKFMPLASFFATMSLWHFFFSPPTHARLSLPVYLAGLIIMTHYSQTKREKYRFRTVINK